MSRAPAKLTARENRPIQLIAEVRRAVEELQETIEALNVEQRSMKVQRNWK